MTNDDELNENVFKKIIHVRRDALWEQCVGLKTMFLSSEEAAERTAN